MLFRFHVLSRLGEAFLVWGCVFFVGVMHYSNPDRRGPEVSVQFLCWISALFAAGFLTPVWLTSKFAHLLIYRENEQKSPRLKAVLSIAVSLCAIVALTNLAIELIPYWNPRQRLTLAVVVAVLGLVLRIASSIAKVGASVVGQFDKSLKDN